MWTDSVKTLAYAWPLVVLLGGCPAAEPDNSDEVHVCGDLSRAQFYRPALAPLESEGELDVRLLSVDPEPPSVGDNVWTVAISDDSGGPNDPCTCTVRAFAPDHAMGVAPAPTCGPGESSQFLEIELTLPMPALYEISLEVQCGASSASALWVLCAEG